jgi:hypothetical protein
MDNILTIQQLLERHRKYNIETHLLFIEYVKHFIQFYGEKWETMNEKDV